MKVLLISHQGKETGFARALRIGGHDFARNVDEADAVMVDSDDPGFGPRRAILEMAHEKGIATFLYPHGGNPALAWDGLVDPFPVTAAFVIGEGQKEVMRRYGYPHPIEVAGWTFCIQYDFKPVQYLRSILFAPVHPPSNPDFPPFEFELKENRRAFDELLTLNVPITVRYIGDLEANGIPYRDDVTYVKGDYGNQVGQIDDHDLVVASSTYASMAVARGKAVIQFCQDEEQREDVGERRKVNNWHLYHNYMRYPLVIGDRPIRDLAAAACAGTPKTARWRELFVGDDLRPTQFGKRLEELACVAA